MKLIHFIFLADNTTIYKELITTSNLIKSFSCILAKTPAFLYTTEKPKTTMLDVSAGSFPFFKLHKQYEKSPKLTYPWFFEDLDFSKMFYFNKPLYIENVNTKEKIELKRGDAFLRGIIFRENELWLFYKNFTYFAINLNDIDLTKKIIYLDQLPHRRITTDNNILNECKIIAYGNVKESSAGAAANAWGVVNENVFAEIPLQYEEKFEYDLLKFNNDLKVEMSVEHNDLNVNSLFGKGAIPNFSYFLNNHKLNIFISETLSLSQSNILTFRLYGSTEYINLDPPTTNFFKGDKFLDYLFTNGSAFMTSKNYANQQLNFTKEQTTLNKQIADLNISKSVIGGITGLVTQPISGAISGTLAAGGNPAGGIIGGISGGLNAAYDAAFGIAGSALSYKQTELNNRIALANAENNIAMINAQQEDLSRQSDITYSNDKAKASVNVGFNQGYIFNSSSNKISLNFYMWEHSDKMKKLLNDHYKIYGWKNNKLFTFKKEIKKSPKFDHVKINNCIVRNIPKIYLDIIIDQFNKGIWFLNDQELTDIYNLNWKENKIWN